MHQKLAPDPFLILLNNPKQPLHARNSFENKIFWKRIIKKSTLFQTQSLLMYKVIKNKRGPSSYESSSEKFLYYLYTTWPSLICNIKQLLSYFKNYICKFMQANSRPSYSNSICPFVSSKCRNEGKKIQKFGHLENISLKFA